MTQQLRRPPRAGTLAIAAGTGVVGAVINEISTTVTWATSDANTGLLLKNAINASANPLVAGFMTATNVAGVVTVTAANEGIQGKAICLAATGTGATASGARLTGGVAATASVVGFLCNRGEQAGFLVGEDTRHEVHRNRIFNCSIRA